MDTETKLLLWGIALGIAALNEKRDSDAAVDNKSTMENFLEAAWRAATHTKEELENQFSLASACVEQRRELSDDRGDGTLGVMAYLADVKDTELRLNSEQEEN
ncbi:MAG: hypothetical protein KDB26_12610 [Microthrixaceae bacterium]|nr:hypothetical protein [Microthrixaceae bacterium]